MKITKAKVGLFLIGGVLLFAVGLFLIGNRNQVFSHHFDAYTEFTSVDTIESGAKVRVAGMDAGEVGNVRVPEGPAEKFRMELHIDEKLLPVVRQDSVATIETEGMVGNKYVNIAQGSSGSPECKGCTLPSREPVEMSALLAEAKDVMGTTQASISDLRKRADRTIDNIGNASGHADQMIVAMRGNVEKIAANGANLTSGVNGIVSDIRKGNGAAGKLLTDRNVASNVQETIANAKNTTANLEQASQKANTIVSQFESKNIPEDVHRTAANAREISEELKQGVTQFASGGDKEHNVGEQIRQTIDDAQRATENLASDTEAIKHNFFLRGFFNRRGYYNLDHLNRTEYADSDFVKHAKERIWLAADNLFDTTANGSQELSKEGQQVLNGALSRIADNLPNNPIMIEGYAVNGPAAERFLVARQRADEVRKYLDSRYHLNPDLVGTIPLEDKPPRGTGLESWDGVCLAMVVSHD